MRQLAGGMLAVLLLAMPETTSAVSDPNQLPGVPGVPTPAGYGHYCSVTDPTNGGWVLGALGSNKSDPCGNLAGQVGPNAIVQRAGLYALNGNNQAMARCDGGMVTGRVWGSAVISWITGQVSRNDRNCVFTIAPTKLPVWGPPFIAKVSGTSVYDYNYVEAGWDVAEFGGIGSGGACSMDRTATQTGVIDGFGKCVNFKPAGKFMAVEPAYDWNLPMDTPIRAVAHGVIRASYTRNTAPICNGSNQLELFLETQVGTGQYAEHFIAAYHHMNPNPNTANVSIALKVAAWGGKPMAPAGTIVKKGDIIAYNGSSGCSGSPHLDLSVLRLTNLTGARAYTFQALDTIYDASGNPISGGTGINGSQGAIDPFGWTGPKNVDPMAFKYIGMTTSDQPSGVTDPGAFGIKLWEKKYINGQQLYDAFELLPHNGGDSW